MAPGPAPDEVPSEGGKQNNKPGKFFVLLLLIILVQLTTLPAPPPAPAPWTLLTILLRNTRA